MNKKLLLSFLTFIFLTSCIAVLTSGTKSSFNLSRRNVLKQHAESGDAESQYMVGSSYCCGYGAVYDNVEATKWLCKAARQGYVKAQKKIGWVYSPERGFAPPVDKIREQSLKEDVTLSYSWYRIAAISGDPEANKQMRKMQKRLTANQFRQALTYVDSYPNLPCEINN